VGVTRREPRLPAFADGTRADRAQSRWSPLSAAITAQRLARGAGAICCKLRVRGHMRNARASAIKNKVFSRRRCCSNRRCCLQPIESCCHLAEVGCHGGRSRGPILLLRVRASFRRKIAPLRGVMRRPGRSAQSGLRWSPDPRSKGSELVHITEAQAAARVGPTHGSSSMGARPWKATPPRFPIPHDNTETRNAADSRTLCSD